MPRQCCPLGRPATGPPRRPRRRESRGPRTSQPAPVSQPIPDCRRPALPARRSRPADRRYRCCPPLRSTSGPARRRCADCELRHIPLPVLGIPSKASIREGPGDVIHGVASARWASPGNDPWIWAPIAPLAGNLMWLSRLSTRTGRCEVGVASVAAEKYLVRDEFGRPLRNSRSTGSDTRHSGDRLVRTCHDCLICRPIGLLACSRLVLQRAGATPARRQPSLRGHDSRARPVVLGLKSVIHMTP
ncbi:hypothetical protein MSS2_00409 [Mycobacterium marinum]|nr:hypothetical protein MSS2_00409 [Mycobacterium marinum]